MLGTVLDTEYTEISKTWILSSRSSQSTGEDIHDENNSKQMKKEQAQRNPNRGSILKCSYTDSGQLFMRRGCLSKTF